MKTLPTPAPDLPRAKFAQLALFFALSTMFLALFACAPVERANSNAGVEDAAAEDATSLDATLPSAHERLAGVWSQTLTAYPDMRVIWSMHPNGWGNIDVRGASGTWCRNYVDWQISSEVSASEFVYAYTFTQDSCGESVQGDSLSVTVLQELSADPLQLATDWGGGATMQLCGRDFLLTDPCQEGDSLGAPAQNP